MDMGQDGFARIMAALVLCLVISGGTYLGFHSAHASAPSVRVAQASVAKQPAVVKAPDHLEPDLVAAWQQAVRSTPPDGSVDVAVFDSKTGITAHYSNQPSTYLAASAIKLSILETLLWQNQQNGIASLTSGQLEEAAPMIENSDNDVTDSLYLSNGGSHALNAFFSQIGADDSSASGPWGLTRTTALDQLKVIGEIAYPGKLLTPSSADQANNLLSQVVSDQLWGVNAGVPNGVSVQLKNGWLSNEDVDGSDGWNVNSVGHVHGDGEDYTIAVLTNGDNTLQDGIELIQVLSASTWSTIKNNSVSK